MEKNALAPDEALRWARIGALAALAMALGYLETFVPIPVPGVKLGLANVAVLVMLASGDVRGAFWVAALKVVTSGLLFGSPVTMAYSAVGTALAFGVMAPLSRLRTMRLEMVSVTGALAHQAGQLMVAQTLLGTRAVWYGAPVLMVAGCVTGFICGMVAVRALALLDQQGTDEKNVGAARGEKRATGDVLPVGAMGTVRVDPRVALVLLFATLVVTMRLSSVAHLAVAAAAGLAFCLALGVRPRDVARALRPVALMCAITVVAQALTVRGGTPLVVVGPLTVTDAALAAALASTLRLVAVVLVSLAYVRAQGSSGMAEGLRWLLSPLDRLGVSLVGPAYALDVAFAILPVLASGIAGAPRQDLGQGGLRAALDALPNLVVQAWRLAEAASEGQAA